MPRSDTTEREFERIIVDGLTSQAPGYIESSPEDYDRNHAVDWKQLLAFLQATQPRIVEQLGITDEGPKRLKFLARLQGVNLHRSNVVINYDIPWNPTRLMQRVGRINRVDTTFDKVYTLNFFPTKQSNNQLKLKEAAEAKIHAFISLLGADARLLTEGEAVESHELFNRLISKKTITGEDEMEETELKYLQIIRDIRDKDPDLFTQIKHLPQKARTAKQSEETE